MVFLKETLENFHWWALRWNDHEISIWPWNDSWHDFF